MDPDFLELTPAETFDPAAFIENAEVPQAVCNFVLALALVYNDCKDIVAAQIAIESLKPAGKPEKTAQWGAYYGLQHHAVRMLITAIHELLKLIRTNQPSVGHPFFQSVVRNIHPRAR